MELTVIKVGGSVLGERADLRRAAAAIAARHRRGEALFVVVSALAGVTDHLVRSCYEALDPSSNGCCRDTVARLRQRHQEVARGLNDGVALDSPLTDVEDQLNAIRRRGEVAESAYARLLSSGERLSVHLMAAAIREAGVDARAVTAEELGVYARGTPSHGACRLDASTAGFRKVRPELRDRVVVLTGFYGVDEAGGVVLFGRGGSDDTGSVSAVALDAENLELWKDVPGCMSGDPKLVPGARRIPELSFVEAATLHDYGSSIVHADCLEPLRGRPIRVTIGALEGIRIDGTRLLESPRRRVAAVTALTVRAGRTEFRLETLTQERQRIARLLAGLRKAGTRLDILSAEPHALRFLVSDSEVEKARSVLGELGEEDCVWRYDPPLVTAVGDGIAQDESIRSRMRERLAAIGVSGFLQPHARQEARLSSPVSQEDIQRTLHGLHDLFFPESMPTESHVSPA
jgi:aspartate kinase